ncbi:aKG-HExxH-type peptide beta-hydroxylase [Nonomuraea sp. NPDC052265]|uniref:aKG-HExxH-type peptide beta-hydroxylase n=1 Tax=Nonomuraea sp. NPDC052265 TaxID=3364374 RepID=UPI0037CCA287
MTTTLPDPLTELDGMPFLDDGFAARRLLAGAAAARHVEAERQGRTSSIPGTASGVEQWLAPARIVLLRPSAQPIPAGPLSPGENRLIDDALRQILVAVPAWEVLVRLPVRYALLHAEGGAISASSRAWPQHVLLAPEAFATPLELVEHLLHELSHQWLYLIQELWALDGGHAERLTLPSGTAGRTPSEVLGAAHVAAVLTRLYRTTGGQAETRLTALRDYGLGCLNLLDSRVELLTPAGWQIARRLKEAL